MNPNCVNNLISHTSQERFNEAQDIASTIQKCNAICHYALCFSRIMSCKFWKETTLVAFSAHGLLLNYDQALKSGNCFHQITYQKV